jgi:hypothetical protein
MADLVKSARASMDASTGMFAPQKTGDLYAGEALGACVPCYIKSADGKVYQSNGTAIGEAAKFDGFTPTSHGIGEPVALFGVGARFRYGTGLTIGADLYISATAGNLSDTATTGGVRAIARVMTATDIVVTKNSDQA